MALKVIDGRWAGDSLDDLIAYFDAEPDEYPAQRVVAARCALCSGRVFMMETDDSSTCVRRTCTTCHQTVHMLDSQEYWASDEEDEPTCVIECECGSDAFETAVGFTFYDSSPASDVTWVSVAVRCAADGALGYCASWKIGYGPSRHLVDEV